MNEFLDHLCPRRPRLGSARLADFARANTLSEIFFLTSRTESIVPGISDFNFIFAQNHNACPPLVSSSVYRRSGNPRLVRGVGGFGEVEKDPPRRPVGGWPQQSGQEPRPEDDGPRGAPEEARRSIHDEGDNPGLGQRNMGNSSKHAAGNAIESVAAGISIYARRRR